MVKKLVLGALFLMISAALIYGGIHRTAARLENGNGFGGRDRQQITSGDQTEFNSNGYRGGEHSGNVNDENILPELIDQIVFNGNAVEVTADYLIVKTDDGQEVLVENRAWWFAQDAGFSAIPGDKIVLAGFIDDGGTFEVSWLFNQTSSQEIFIRDDSGRPNWAGNGRNRN